MNHRESPGAPTLPFMIRPAVAEDADLIARTFLGSAEHHAALDPARYVLASLEAVSTRYRCAQQDPSEAGAEVITLVAELCGEIVGFVDARLDRSPDPMHRTLLHCVIAEISVSRLTRARCGLRIT